MPLDASRATAALRWLCPNEYAIWVDVAIWLKAAYGDAAYPVWLDWGERAEQEAQAGNEGRYAPERVWAGISPRITAEQGAGALYAQARDNVVVAARNAAATGQWAGQGKAALVYLKRYHPGKYDELFGVTA